MNKPKEDFVTRFIKNNKFKIKYSVVKTKINENVNNEAIDFIKQINKLHSIISGTFIEVLVRYALQHDYMFMEMIIIDKELTNLLIELTEYYNSLNDDKFNINEYIDERGLYDLKYHNYIYEEEIENKTLDMLFIINLTIYFYSNVSHYISQVIDKVKDLTVSMKLVIDNFDKIYDILDYLSPLKNFFNPYNIKFNQHVGSWNENKWFTRFNYLLHAPINDIFVNGYADIVINSIDYIEEGIKNIKEYKDVEIDKTAVNYTNKYIIDVKCSVKPPTHLHYLRQLYVYKLGLQKNFADKGLEANNIKLFVISIYDNMIYEYIIKEDVVI